MTYGQVGPQSRARTVALILSLLLTLFSGTRPASARPAAPFAAPETLLSIGERAVQVQGSDGRSLTLTLTPGCVFLRRGLPASRADFAPGESVCLRVRKGEGGGKVVLLCDPETAALLDKYRGRTVTGTLAAVGAGAWAVLPVGEDLPLTIRLSPRTVFEAGGAPGTALAFGAGASVSVTMRVGADGLPVAVLVSDTSEPATDTPRLTASLSGRAVEVQTGAGTLTLEDGLGASHTVAVDGATRLTVWGQPGALADIAPGMHVTARLGAGQDAAGYPLAVRLSASDARPRKGKRVRAAP